MRIRRKAAVSRRVSVRFNNRHFTRLLFYVGGALSVAVAQAALASPRTGLALLLCGYMGLHLVDGMLRD